ncbi:MAG: amidohydrolase [Caldilineaceae bacterium]|nr:amidohydrolase [Caldilineaceae bacterium]
MQSTIQEFKAQAAALQPQLVAWRRDFHMHPELGFQEVRTAGIVADHLRSLGLEVTTGIGKTGVVAVVEGDDAPAEAPTVMLRFDMDALPIMEENDAPYASQNPGVMHACGHDGHTAIGMGVATLLTQHRQGLAGRVKLVFQPAEEGLGGARAMLADGVMHDPQPAAAFGMHLWSRLPLNQIVVQPGPLWAGADKVDLIVSGQGGHGAMPHETIDAIYVASQIVIAWQGIISRSIDPAEPAVITVGSFHAGTACNVIAGTAELACSIRSLTLAMRDFLVRRMHEVAEGVCAAHGATCELTFTSGVPPTINDPAGAALMQGIASALVGEPQVAQITPMMVGEDMSEFLNRAPGCYVLVGAWDPDKPLNSPHHSPTFDFDERMLATGAALLAVTAVEYLQRNG